MRFRGSVHLERRRTAEVPATLVRNPPGALVEIRYARWFFAPSRLAMRPATNCGSEQIVSAAIGSQ